MIKWSDSFSVNVVVIDDQHKRLIEIIGNLGEAMKKGKGKDVVKNILGEMAAYTKNHFKTEEELFEKFGYENTAKHKAEHEKFVAKVLDFKKDFEEGRIGLSVSVMNFLSEWLREHILVSDHAYKDFMKSNNLV